MINIAWTSCTWVIQSLNLQRVGDYTLELKPNCHEAIRHQYDWKQNEAITLTYSLFNDIQTFLTSSLWLLQQKPADSNNIQGCTNNFNLLFATTSQRFVYYINVQQNSYLHLPLRCSLVLRWIFLEHLGSFQNLQPNLHGETNTGDGWSS